MLLNIIPCTGQPHNKYTMSNAIVNAQNVTGTRVEKSCTKSCAWAFRQERMVTTAITEASTMITHREM